MQPVRSPPAPLRSIVSAFRWTPGQTPAPSPLNYSLSVLTCRRGQGPISGSRRTGGAEQAARVGLATMPVRRKNRLPTRAMPVLVSGFSAGSQ